ncbi:MAG: hypothetical protein EXS35_14825 [Pedosphaera sp.]|nr:hypothetical protein [Pedosphaera sp.]
MPTLDQLTRDAVSENRTIATNAIRSLRARGPEGLRALLETHAETLKQHDANRNRPAATVQPDESWQRLKAALDGVSKQRDCFASKLFWYTDFESAKAAARAADKPILSLRLLGQLDEEFSCANSRFFRTTLYANAEVARFLNDYFILHWKSVRPVPKVTIDFGDGRKLERTLTGNSIHYVLDAEGRVIDALPGLYGAQTFLRELHRAEDATRAVAKLTDEPRQSALRDFHRTRLLALNSEYAADLQRLSAPTPVRFETTAATSIVPGAQPPTAQAAGRLAGGKRRVEMPILKRTANATDNDDAIWQRIGDLHTDTARVDESARALIREKAPTAIAAAQFTRLKAFVENPVLRQIRNLERSISEDTARNEYLFHTRIHDWLANGAAPAEVDKLNTKVYAELFLTPDSDPWLGLLPNDTFAALENDGITVTTKR